MTAYLGKQIRFAGLRMFSLVAAPAESSLALWPPGNERPVFRCGVITHSHWIWMLALLGIWRVVMDYAISPRVLGHQLEIHPLLAIFTVMAGGAVSGIAGIYDPRHDRPFVTERGRPTVFALKVVQHSWSGALSVKAFSDCSSVGSNLR